MSNAPVLWDYAMKCNMAVMLAARPEGNVLKALDSVYVRRQVTVRMSSSLREKWCHKAYKLEEASPDHRVCFQDFADWISSKAKQNACPDAQWDLETLP